MNKKLTPLEALRNLTQIAYYNQNDTDNNIKNYFKIIEKSLKEKETPTETFEDFVGEPSEVICKKLKALEIIKRHLFLQYSDNLCVYILCQWIDKNSWRIIQTLTQEEYDLLKEVLV